MRPGLTAISFVLVTLCARAQEKTTFKTVDLWLDCGTQTLAAYQVDIRYDATRTKIVGLEGGTHAAFADAPRYDAAGLTGGRIVIAAFSTSNDLPKGRIRVARLHLKTTIAGTPQLTIKLIAAGNDAAIRITPVVSYESTSREGPK